MADGAGATPTSSVSVIKTHHEEVPILTLLPSPKPERDPCTGAWLSFPVLLAQKHTRGALT